MFGRGSPKISLIQVASMQRNSSPRCAGKRKKRSPKAKNARANWNLRLEKGLVEKLHDHNNDWYRGQNGWSSEAWNLMIRKFHEKFLYAPFTKDQIQELKELKRDYNVLKEARRQSGVHWDDKLCMIIAEPPIWNNIIVSHPRASKFQRQGFPLYDDLEKLYDGKTAEGNLAFISVQPKEGDDGVRIVQPPMEKVAHDEPMGRLAILSGYDEHDDEVRIVNQPNQVCAATSSRVVVEREEEPAASGAKGTKVGQKNSGDKVGQKRKQTGDVAEMMGKYLELKTKQTEKEVAEQERTRTKAEALDFSIQNCNALPATMEELSGEERADAYDVFKDIQNREIFVTANPSSRLIWLRKKIRLMNTSY